MSVAYFNGQYMALEDVRVSPLDRGFLFGDGVYEVIPCYGGRLFEFERHIQRLERSLQGIRLSNPLELDAWVGTLNEVVKRNGGAEQLVYLQVTRGVAPRDHKFPLESTQTVFVMSKPWDRPDRPPAIDVITEQDNRWERCDIKATTLLANVLLRQQAIDAGAQECLLIRDGNVLEGAASNVFVVSGQSVATPPKDVTILPGITRDVVVRLAQQAGIDIAERPVSMQELQSADEVWVSSSSMELRPVVSVDGKPVGNGQPGEVWAGLFARLRHAAFDLSNSI